VRQNGRDLFQLDLRLRLHPLAVKAASVATTLSGR